jgi:electron transport complex protein RnfA
MPITNALIVIGALLLNYVAVMRFLNLSQIFAASVERAKGSPTKIDNSQSLKITSLIGINSAVILFLAVILNQIVEKFILIPLSFDYLNLPLCLVLMLLLSQLITRIAEKSNTHFYPLMERFLPLSIFNSAALFIFFIYPESYSNLVKAAFHSIAVGLGFTVILMAFMTLQYRLAWNEVPAPFKGYGILIITASLLVISLAGFSNLLFSGL